METPDPPSRAPEVRGKGRERMTDIVERLRAGEPCTDAGGKAADCSSKTIAGGCTCAEAADEIGRLRAENAEQKAEMQKLYNNWSRVVRDDVQSRREED